MRILIAPDKFKGALSARDVATNIAHGIRDDCTQVEVEIVPMADGGEGTAEVICDALRGSWVKCKARDALGRQIDARYAWIQDRRLAVLEMSEAAGMWRLAPNELDIEHASTFGVGEMILDAIGRGAVEITVGLGGSATNDAGVGMARALGFRFFTADRELNYLGSTSASVVGVSELQNLTRIIPPSCSARSPLPQAENQGEGNSLPMLLLALPKITAAADVRNPLLGENGATRVFGAQKGAVPRDVENLEAALNRLADVVAQQFGFDYRGQPASGAAGGLGFGLMSFCGAAVRSGFEVVAESVDLESKVRQADVVITGEGCLDRQTLAGKTAFGIAQMARRNNKRVIAVVGRVAGDSKASDLFDEVYVVSDSQSPEEENIRRAAELVRSAGSKLGKTFNILASRPSNRR